MSARLPVIPTILVIAAVATMIALGFWQLGRAEEKADMLARFEEASASEQSVTFPVGATQEDAWFRRSALDCRKVSDLQPVAGTAATGAKGWAMRATCALSGGGSAMSLGPGATIPVTLPPDHCGCSSTRVKPRSTIAEPPPE
ncbi:MAG: SURF1 family cytochrome oxidase biogenesis protein, partial [Erythrobacter sp.]